MKNLLRFLGIVALIAIVGLSMISCDSGGGGGGSRTPPKVPPLDPVPITWTVKTMPSITSNGVIETPVPGADDGFWTKLLYATGSDDVTGLVTPNAKVTFLKVFNEKVADGEGSTDKSPAVATKTYEVVTPASPSTLGDVFIPAYITEPGKTVPFARVDDEVTVKVDVENKEKLDKDPVAYFPVVSIAKNAFAGGGTTITDIRFAPESVITEIGEAAFYDSGTAIDISIVGGGNGTASGQGVIDVPSSVKIIRKNAFKDVVADVIFINGATVDRIDNGAFENVTGAIIVYGLADRAAADAKWNKEYQKADAAATPAKPLVKTWMWDADNNGVAVDADTTGSTVLTASGNAPVGIVVRPLR